MADSLVGQINPRSNKLHPLPASEGNQQVHKRIRMAHDWGGEQTRVGRTREPWSIVAGFAAQKA